MTRKPLIHLVLLAVILLVLIASYGALHAAVIKRSGQLQALGEEATAKGQDVARVAAAKATLAALSKDEDAVSKHFVAAADVVPFLEALESIGTPFGSKVQVISVSADQAKGRGHLNLSLQITGSFDAVMRTLGALEYAPYDIVLTNLALDTPRTAGKGARAWSAAATFAVGTASSTPSAAPAASSALPKL